MDMINKMTLGTGEAEKLTDYYQGEIFLITPQQFEDNVLEGATLVDIFGEYVVKGRDPISLDVRGGHMAVGYPVDKAPNWIDQSKAIKFKTLVMSDAERKHIKKIGK